jgi:hypothetical protein
MTTSETMTKAAITIDITARGTMGTIFRTATKQAILDLIADHGTQSRFGHLLSDDDAEELASRVVDLFEMTLELRSRTGLMGASAGTGAVASGGQGSQPGGSSTQKSAGSPPGKGISWSEEAPQTTFPKTIHAAEFFDRGETAKNMPDSTHDNHDPVFRGLKLPRTRKPITDAERQSFLRRR